MNDSQRDGFFGFGVCAMIAVLLGGAACGGGWAAYREMRGPIDTHWTRELGEPQWREGGPTPGDRMRENKPFDWNPPQAVTVHP